MKIVWVMPLVPYPPRDGGSIRIYQLLKGLARRHAVHVLALSDSESREGLEAFGQLCRSIAIFENRKLRTARWSREWWRLRWDQLEGPASVYYLPDLHAHLGALARNGQADVILLETLKMATYGPLAFGASFRESGWSNFILCRQNYEPELIRRIAAIQPRPRDRIFARFGAWLLKRAERRVARRYRYITAVSEREAQIFRRLSPGAEIVVVPNGVEVARFSSDTSRDDGRTLMLTGTMRYFPNVDSVRYFMSAIWPQVKRAQPDSRLVVTGHDAARVLADLAQVPGVKVREPGHDIAQILAEATVVVVPLRAAGGTRIKILEALAAGKPVVSTSIGSEGLEVISERHLVICDDPDLFARQVVELLRDPARRARLAASGRELVRERYTWQAAVEALEALCERVAGERRTRRGVA